MSFIGNSFTNQTFVPQVDYFNGNASATAFTLSRNVASVADVQVVIENVPQNPSSAFTVSGNVITFTSAPPSGTNNIYVRYTSPTTNVVKPAPGTVSPTEINSSYSLWNLSGADINYTAGKVGIGTTPSYGLDVRSSDAPAIRLSRSGSSGQIASVVFEDGEATLGTGNTTRVASDSGAMSFSTGGTSGAVTGGTERMRITSAGFVGVGITNPYKRLSVTQASSTAYSTTDFDRDYLAVQIANTTDDKATGIYFATGSNGEAAISAVETSDGETALTFGTRGGGARPERMRITSNGNLIAKQTSVISSGIIGCAFTGGSDNGFEAKNTNTGNSGTFAAFFNSSTGLAGYIAQNGATGVSYVTSSDYRLKENITPMTGAIAKVALLKPCIYTWKEDGAAGQGFIAHELQEVVPEAVIGQKDEVDANGNIKTQGIDTSYLVATLTAAIQEQQAIIEDLKSRIEVLEAK